MSSTELWLHQFIMCELLFLVKLTNCTDTRLKNAFIASNRYTETKIITMEFTINYTWAQDGLSPDDPPSYTNS